MPYLKQEFILYLQKNGNVNPGAYCNGLDNIEKLLSVDIDTEYDKDECKSLYEKLQDLRRNPGVIGKKEPAVRQYASRLKQYVSFRQQKESKGLAEESAVKKGTSIDEEDAGYNPPTDNLTELESRLEGDGIIPNQMRSNASCDHSHNMILYGPPGTGKTYNAVNYAVAICDGKDVKDVMEESYADVLGRYRVLQTAGRIAFTTFHQSYGYEEFIEGIHPVLNKESSTEGLKYELKDGVFRSICKAAMTLPRIWGIRIDDNEVKAECVRDGLIRIDLSERCLDSDHIKFKKMQIGDYVIVHYGNSVLSDAIGVIEDSHPVRDTNKRDRWIRKVKWLVTEIILDVRMFTGGAVFDDSALTEFGDTMLPDLIDVINKNGGQATIENYKPYVIIVDEINRGNISKIFGELITLIEDNKRAGAAEAMEVMLPISGDSFSVPQNVYIIGTMNTADRSIALMDTALRRRFEFIEMMPKSEVLERHGVGTIDVNGIELNVSNMMNVINRRIEYLFDREHTIGHSFFMKLADEKKSSLENLADIFKKKIIPLLQEYFYEDYEKIQLVLGDNTKDDKYKFVLDKKTEDIFNGNPNIDDLPEKVYEIQESAFHELESYKQISKGL